MAFTLPAMAGFGAINDLVVNKWSSIDQGIPGAGVVGQYLFACSQTGPTNMKNKTTSRANPPDLSNVPKGTIIYFEINFHEGPPHNLQKYTLLDFRYYNGAIPLVGYGQLVAFKKEVFDLTKAHIKKYEDDNPSNVSSYINTIWYTDQESKEKVTAYIKCLEVAGVPGTF